MKLLYVKCNPKPEEQSACLRVGRAFVQRYERRFPEHGVEELDLYTTNLPELTGEWLSGRSALVSGEAYDRLPYGAQAQVDYMQALCTQFLSADTVAIAAPMWSASFPPRLKTYVDCVVLNGRAIEVTPKRVRGLLGDKPRRLVFIQSCGGNYHNPLLAHFNDANRYLKSLFLFLGVEEYIRLGVDGTGSPTIGMECAIRQATGRIDRVLDDLMLD